MTYVNRKFLRHYAEMVLAMFAGMIVLGLPLEALLRAAGSGTSELKESDPALVLLGMAVIMTIPIVAWMRRMGHTWQPCAEMAASMFLPTVAIIAVMWGGLVEDFGVLMTAEHVVMLPAMFAAMLLRPQEYGGTCHAHHQQLAV